MNAFVRSNKPSVMNNSQTRKREACIRLHLGRPDYLKPRNVGNFSIDPNPQATVDKRRALVYGGI